MSKKSSKFSFADHLFDQTNKVDSDLSNLGNEIYKVQQVLTKQSRMHEKFSKSCVIQKEKKSFEHFDCYMRELNEFSRNISQVHNNFVKSCSIQVESLERLRKFLDSNRRSIKQRQMNNEKVYYKKKKLLETIKRKQHKHAKEAHERYMKHDKLCRDESVDPNVLDESELRFIHTAKMEEKYSQQYQDVFQYHQDYLDTFIRENRGILKDSEDFYLLVVKNMRAHMLRFVEDQGEIIVGLRKNMTRLRQGLETIVPEERVQRYIQVNKRKKVELDEKHKYLPFIPIYKMGEIEREKELKKIKKSEETITTEQQTNVLQNFFGGMFGRVRKSQFSPHPSDGKLSSVQQQQQQQNNNNNNSNSNNKKSRVSEITSTPGRKRRGTQKVYNTVVRSPQMVKKSVQSPVNAQLEKTESQLFYESLYDELVGIESTSNDEESPREQERLPPIPSSEDDDDEDDGDDDNDDEKKEKKKKKKKRESDRDDNDNDEPEEEVDEDNDEGEGKITATTTTNTSMDEITRKVKRTNPNKGGLGESKKKKALGWLEMVEGRRGLVSALNLKRNQPYIEDYENFDFLGQVISKCLILSHQKQDVSIGSNLLNMSQTFYTIKNDNQLFYFKHLDKMEIWKNIRFWEACFYDLMTNMRKRSMHYQERWRDMDQGRRKEVRKEHANMTYGILTSFIFSMMESEVESAKVRQFVVKMCEINGLDPEQVKLIMAGYETMSSMKNKN